MNANDDRADFGAMERDGGSGAPAERRRRSAQRKPLKERRDEPF